MSFLDKVRGQKVTEIERLIERNQAEPFSRGLEDPIRPFAAALRGSGGVIAEIKRRSPSRPDFNLHARPAHLAACYQRCGASAISIVTDAANFGTSLADVPDVRRASSLPVISKDFIIDPVQVRQAWAAGADAVLLIARMLSEPELGSLLEFAHGLGLEALVECHDEEDIAKSMASGARMVGVNNRDLSALTTDLKHGERLLPMIPDSVVRVSESGIGRRADVLRLAACGAEAFLIGHALLLSGDPGRKLRELTGGEVEDRLRVKICGVTTPDDALLCHDQGADLLGLIFARSPRMVGRKDAQRIRDAVPAARLCGVFVDEDPTVVANMARTCGLDLIQLHGGETPQQCRAVSEACGTPVIKALTPDQVTDGTVADYSGVRYFLLDQPKRGGQGAGPGDAGWLGAAASLADQGADLILAGGLEPEAAAAAVRKLRPFAVDVCRGVESSPGRKDPARVTRFLQEVSR